MSQTVSTSLPFKTSAILKTEEVKDFSKSEADLADVMDTLQHGISIIEKEMAKNPTLMLEGIDTRNTNNAMVAIITTQDLNVNHADHRRFMRKHSLTRCDRTVPWKLGTPKTIEKAHNTVDPNYSVSHVAKIAVKSKDRRDSIQSRSTFSKWNRSASS